MRSARSAVAPSPLIGSSVSVGFCLISFLARSSALRSSSSCFGSPWKTYWPTVSVSWARLDGLASRSARLTRAVLCLFFEQAHSINACQVPQVTRVIECEYLRRGHDRPCRVP